MPHHASRIPLAQRSPLARAPRTLRLALALALIACSGKSSARAGGEQADTSNALVDNDSGEEVARTGKDTGEASANASASPDSATDLASAVAVITEYYADISAHDLHDAYHLWSDGGAASQQTLEEFARGFDDTRSASVVVGKPGRIEGAAGSRYVDIPVTINAITTDGKRLRFGGSYQLRRTVVPGATAEQRSWHIYSARISPVQ